MGYPAGVQHAMKGFKDASSAADMGVFATAASGALTFEGPREAHRLALVLRDDSGAMVTKHGVDGSEISRAVAIHERAIGMRSVEGLLESSLAATSSVVRGSGGLGRALGVRSINDLVPGSGQGRQGASPVSADLVFDGVEVRHGNTGCATGGHKADILEVFLLSLIEDSADKVQTD